MKSIFTVLGLLLSRYHVIGSNSLRGQFRISGCGAPWFARPAAMNGAVNVSIADGWFLEFAIDKINSFIIPGANASLPIHQQDESDANNLYDLLEKEVIPMYYDNPAQWLSIAKNGMKDILPQFDSNRMASEYYEQLY